MSDFKDKVSAEVEQLLFSHVKRDLENFTKKVWAKFIVIHAICGSLTLAFCPQFGIAPWGESQKLMMFFMNFGRLACPFFCGSLFLGFSTLMSLVVLRRTEVGCIRTHSAAYFPLLAAFSVIVFMSLQQLGFSDRSSIDWEFLGLWVLGATFVPLLIVRAEGFLRPSNF